MPVHGRSPQRRPNAEVPAVGPSIGTVLTILIPIRARLLAQLALADRPRSAVDAKVAAMAGGAGGATVLSSDPGDLLALAGHPTNQAPVSRL